MTNLERLEMAVEAAGLDALLLMDDKNIFYATGFMPTDSAALVAPGAAYLVTDSRYIEAAEKQCVPGVEVILTTRERPLLSCLKDLAAGRAAARLGA